MGYKKLDGDFLIRMEILTQGGHGGCQKNKSSESAREMPEVMFLITGSWFVSRVQGVGADMWGGAGRKGGHREEGGEGGGWSDGLSCRYPDLL